MNENKFSGTMPKGLWSRNLSILLRDVGNYLHNHAALTHCSRHLLFF